MDATLLRSSRGALKRTPTVYTTARTYFAKMAYMAGSTFLYWL